MASLKQQIEASDNENKQAIAEALDDISVIISVVQESSHVEEVKTAAKVDIGKPVS